MSDINLLQNQLSPDSRTKTSQILDKLELVLFVLFFLIVLVAAGLFVWNEVAERQQSQITQEVTNRRVQLESTSRNQRDQIVKTQAQLQYMSQLIPAHVYWTNFLQVLNSSSLIGVRLTQLSASSQGVSLGGVSTNFDTIIAFSKNLSDRPEIEKVLLNSVTLSNDQGIMSYQFNMEVTFNPAILTNAPSVN